MLTPLILALVPLGRTLEVYAAASLREAFVNVARSFEKSHPGVKVHLTFAGSQTLAAQIGQGAPADVFASASAKNLEGLAYDPRSRRVFATNRLVVVSSDSKIDLKGLAKVERIVLATRPVPAGGYAREALAKAGRKYGSDWLAQVERRVVSEENDVRAVLAKVQLGEADAGIVYASDAKGQFIPAEFQPSIEYPAVVLREASEPALARDFLKALLSKDGRRALKERGFGSP